MTAAADELIGVFLAYPDTFAEYANQLSEHLLPSHAELYALMREVHRTEGLTYRGVLTRVPPTQVKYVADLRQVAYNENRIPLLIRELKREHLSRELRKIGATLADSDVDPDEALMKLQEAAFDLRTSDATAESDPERDLDEFAEYVEAIHENPELAYGIMTGIPPLDKLTMGWQRQELSVIGARTSMGKSAFMLQNVLEIHKRGYQTAIFSLEMSKRQIYQRLTANLMHIAVADIKFGRLPPAQLKVFRQRKEELRGIYIDDTRGVDAEHIGDGLRRLKRKGGVDFAVVDYIQDVKEKGEVNDNAGSAIARICRKLRVSAQECDCHIMGLSQVTRSVEDRIDKRPSNADLSGSTGIETSADVIAFLYRDEYYDKNTERKGVMEVNFTKQRNGGLGSLDLRYNTETQRITAVNYG